MADYVNLINRDDSERKQSIKADQSSMQKSEMSQISQKLDESQINSKAKNDYLYVVEPDEGGISTEDPNWEGQIEAIKRSTESAIEESQRAVIAQFDKKLDMKFLATEKLLAASDKDVKNQIQRLSEKTDKLIQASDQKVTHQIKMLEKTMIKALRKGTDAEYEVDMLESNTSELRNQDKEMVKNRFKKAQTHAPRIMNKNASKD